MYCSYCQSDVDINSVLKTNIKDGMTYDSSYSDNTPTTIASDSSIINVCKSCGQTEYLFKNMEAYYATLSTDELREKTEEESNQNAELQKPCKRTCWVQPYSPFEGHYGQRYTAAENFFPKGYSLLLWYFTECDCPTCKETRIYKRENPSDYATHVKMDEILARHQTHLESLNPYHTVSLEILNEVCRESGGDSLLAFNDATLLENWFKYRRFEEWEKKIFMQQFRVFVNDFEYLSKEEINRIECDEDLELVIWGVEWATNGGGWKCKWLNGDLKMLGSSLLGRKLENEKIFPCKRMAVQHFQDNHKHRKGFPDGVISRMP